MKRKNVLVSAYFAKNVGDDLFLKVLFDRYQDVNWYLLTGHRYYKDVFENYQHVNIIPYYREIGNLNLFLSWCLLTGHIKKYDAFVMIGGSIFMQHKQWEKVFLTRTRIINLFNKNNLPTYIIGANFGPYQDKRFLKKYEHHFSKYTGICFRDMYSYNLFKQLPDVRMAPDAVFTLNVNKRVKPRTKSLGISPILLRNRDDLKLYENQYHLKLKEIIEHYLHKEYDIKLFSFCEYEGDLESVEQILKLLPEEYHKQISVINYTGNLESFIRAFQTCSIVIGTRFHSLILAMKFNQKFFPIIYSDKTIHSLKGIGINKLGHHIREIHTLKINEIERLLNYTMNQNVFKEAERQFYYLDQLLTVKKEKPN